ncbi:ephrin-A4 isoform X2 [Mirounga angustirostris]|uniref:ephrin-A4 isoform X2 n=1 Tax=Mirounga angustirostris TaxID=9716 RepID=UPI001E68CDAF|nr:ephrin-A4 isoform X2 [Mirounga angustirostris]
MGTAVPSPLNTCKLVTAPAPAPPLLDSVSQELSGWETQASLSCSLSSGWGRGWKGPPGPSRPWGAATWPFSPPLPDACRLLGGDAVVKLELNDYLDIFCPHYEGPGPPDGPETFALYMVERPGYEACQAQGPGAFKRWECALPFAPFGPVRFSEKIQRFTPFSLGFEFLPGETYYYISVPTPESSGKCLRLQVSVCCEESKSESAHPVGSPGESGTSGWRGGGALSPLCLLLLFLLPILRLLRVL